MSGPRIAINTTCAVAGGAVTHLRHLLPELAARVSDEEIVLLGDPGARDRIDPPGEFKWIDLEGASTGLFGRIWTENVQVSDRVRDLGADVLFHPGNFGLFRCPVPQVILIHNLAPYLEAVISGESIQQKIRLRLLKRLTDASLHRVSRAIFISDWGRKLVVGEPEGVERRYPVIPFGAEHLGPSAIEADVSRWGVRPGGFVLTVSHLYRYKKLEKLIDAYVELGDRVAEWPLVVVGELFDQAYADELRERARGSIAPIVFTGGLDGAAVGSLMSGARAFVFTSEAENLPITLLEAMSAGLPIITNRHCSMPEVCSNAALYADASASGYRKALEAILWDDAARAEMSARARARAAEFRWADAAQATLALLRDAAQPAGESSGRLRGSMP